MSDCFVYFPTMFNFGEIPDDGRGGPPVDDAGTIYFINDKIFYRTTLRELIDRAIDDSKCSDGSIPDWHIASLGALREAFKKASEDIELAILSSSDIPRGRQ